MDNAESDSQQPEKKTQDENARIGYQVASNLWTYEGETTWARFNILLVANSIIIGIIGLVVMNEHKLPHISIALPLVGLALCVAWSFITERGFQYQKYWVKCAQELEERFLAPVVKTASRGSNFAAGKTVEFELNDEPRTLQMSPWSSIRSARKTAAIVIGLFALVYVLALVYSLFVKRVLC